MSERASEQMSAAVRASKARSAERANERADERMAQYSTRRFHIISTHSALALQFSYAKDYYEARRDKAIQDSWCVAEWEERWAALGAY